MKKRRVILTFPSQLIEQPITYNLIKDYNIMVNILKARVAPKEEGRMVIEISGESKALQEGTKWLESLGIKVEPLIQEIKWKEDRCAHCTACVPICPTGAWNLDREKMIVTFLEDKCILCELCPPVCPYRAIEILF
ncbi:MAG: NIL domain-containing protein [Thermodesulfobacteriota bacterium]|nr:NIL domain-containing protein [Thermodesulfobacteriota bacterium]